MERTGVKLAVYLGVVFHTLLDYGACAQKIRPLVPVLPVTPGTRYPIQASQSAPLNLELFIELNCGDSAAALPVLLKVADYYGPEVLSLVIHQLPLPYHRNGFVLTQGLFVIRDNMPDKQMEYMQVMLRRLDPISSEGTKNIDDSAVLNRISRFAARATGIDRDIFRQEVPRYQTETRNVWKFGVSRGVSGTPTYFLNGINLGVDASQRLSKQEWISYLDQLVPADKQNSSAILTERISRAIDSLQGLP